MITPDAVKLFDLTGKVAIVTGAASGIGRAVAIELAKFGANIALVDVQVEKIHEVDEEIKKIGRDSLIIIADVSNRAEVENMVQKVLNKFGKIDILVNCAGIFSRVMAIEKLTEENIDRIFAVNFKGTVFCCQEVMKHMMKRRCGKIVNIGSSLSSRASIANLSGGGADYCASKAAVQCFTRALAWQLAPYRINVNAVAPGIAETPMHEGFIELMKKSFIPSIPFGRLAHPEDIAHAVIFLVSDASNYITGQTIHINGGQIMVD